jgi:hypothetical protein
LVGPHHPPAGIAELQYYAMTTAPTAQASSLSDTPSAQSGELNPGESLRRLPGLRAVQNLPWAR